MHSAKESIHTADFKNAEAYILNRLQNELAPTLSYHESKTGGNKT